MADTTRRIEIDRAELRATIRRGNTPSGEWRICADDGKIFWSQNGREDYGHEDHVTFAVPATDPDGSGRFSDDFRDWIGNNGVADMTPERRAELRELVEEHGTYAVADEHLTPAEAADLEAGQDSYADDLAQEVMWTLQGISDTPVYIFDRAAGEERKWVPAPDVEFVWATETKAVQTFAEAKTAFDVVHAEYENLSQQIDDLYWQIDAITHSHQQPTSEQQAQKAALEQQMAALIARKKAATREMDAAAKARDAAYWAEKQQD